MRHAIMLALVALGFAGSAHAQGRFATRTLPGYACMELNLSGDQVRDPNFVVPIYEQPLGGSRVIASAPLIVIAKSPPHNQDGFSQVVTYDRRVGWIKSSALRPHEQCVPAVMNDGSYGIR